MQGNNLTNDEILRFAMDSGMLDVSTVRSQIVMMNRNKILEKQKIWQGKNGFWYTYLPNPEKGRKLCKKKTREDIENLVCDFYDVKQDIKTFRVCFYELLELKRENGLITNNTYNKSKLDFKRFFDEWQLVDTEISKINSEQIKMFIVKRTKDLNLLKKAMKSLYGYLKSTFFHARANRYVLENPFDFVPEMKFFLPHCQVVIMDESKRIVSSEQSELLQEQFKKDAILKPNYIPTYAVWFSMLTGMRVGEISALKWSEISDGCINVCREEIYDREEKKSYVADYVKNRKPRIIPLTDEVNELLQRLKQVEETFDYLSDYVFSNEKGRIGKRTISDCARNKSMQVGIDVKSIHAHRRTLNSAIKENGASNKVASEILGNSETVNENYYTYDLTDFEYKKKLLESAQRTVLVK